MSAPLGQVSYAYSRVEAPRVQTMDAESGLDRCIDTLRRSAENDLTRLKNLKRAGVCIPLTFASITIPMTILHYPIGAVVFPIAYSSALASMVTCGALSLDSPTSKERLKLMTEYADTGKLKELALTYINEIEFLKAVELADNIDDPGIQSGLYSDVSLFLIKREKNVRSVTQVVAIVQKIQDPEVKSKTVGAIFSELGLHLKGIQDLVREIEVTSPISIETAKAEIATYPKYDSAINSIITRFSGEAPVTSAQKQTILKRIGGSYIKELMPLLTLS